VNLVTRPLRPFQRLLTPAQGRQLELLTSLVQRDLVARYKGSLLGNFWPLLNQLAQLMIYTYVFSIVLQVKPGALQAENPLLEGVPASSLTFGLWLFAGLIPWMAFTSGFAQAASAVTSQPNLVKKVVFPLGLLPMVPIFTAFVESTIGLATLLVFVLVFLRTAHLSVLLLPLVWLPQLLLTLGLGYLCAGLTVFLRDIPQTIGIILNLWFYLTPIVYPLNKIPQPFQDWVRWGNPLATIGEVYRDLVLVGRMQHWLEWGITTTVAALIFCLGLWVYRRLRPAFADVL
jgi:lipopolysaccharide transport system permease protein